MTNKQITQAYKMGRHLFLEHITPEWDAVNMTTLAEAIAHELHHDEWLDDETSKIWDIAFEIGVEYDEQKEDL
jgi:hypothetical protein